MGRYSIEQKLQMEFIKKPNKMHILDLDDKVLITNGAIGVYITKYTLLINVESYIKNIDIETGEITEHKELEMQELFDRTEDSYLTDRVYLMKSGTIVRKIISKSNKVAFASISDIEKFGENVEFKVEDKTKPICVVENGNVKGLIMPYWSDELSEVEKKEDKEKEEEADE
jgi:hypothetical protein